MYAHLAASNEQAAASKLYEILEPGVSVYYLFGPETKHPSHREGEWQVNLYQSRWHAAVYPVRRASANGKTYEMWVLFYCGHGKWSRRLRPHHFYFGAEVDNTTSRRRIIYRSEEFPGNPDVGISVKSITLPNGALKLPLIAGES